jgi:hypothetical protein
MKAIMFKTTLILNPFHGHIWTMQSNAHSITVKENMELLDSDIDRKFLLYSTSFSGHVFDFAPIQ